MLINNNGKKCYEISRNFLEKILLEEFRLTMNGNFLLKSY